MNTKSVDSPLVSLTDVSFSINNQNILSNINLTINSSDNLCLIGPNGAGKSTLVKLILGLITPSSGTIQQSNKLVIGYVPQSFSVPDILPLRVVDLLKQARKKRLSKVETEILYQQLFLTDVLYRQVSTLSGGEKQRVLLARALLEKPNLLILDEPMQGLDPESEELLYRFIDDLPVFLHCSIFVVSHDLHWVMRGSRHVICLNKHICCEGQPTDIQDLDEFQQLFANHHRQLNNTSPYAQPYIHNHQQCQHGMENQQYHDSSAFSEANSKHSYEETHIQ